jgi:hypothetical protein
LYHAKAAKVDSRDSANTGQPMVEVQFELTKDADGKKLKPNYANVWYYAPLNVDNGDVSPGWARRLKELVTAYGLKISGGNLATIEGKEALIRLKEDTDQDGEYRPRISKILKAGAVEPDEDEDETEAEGDEEEVEAYEEWSLADLKAELKERDLKATGSKAALIARLEEDDVAAEAEEDEDEDEDDEDVDLESMDRKELKAFIKEEDLDVKVLRTDDEDDIRAKIEEAMGEEEEEEEEDEEDEDEEDEDEEEAEGDNYEEMSVADLRQELSDRELDSKGIKKVLIARLRKDDASEPV